MSAAGRAWMRWLKHRLKHWTKRWLKPPTVELDDRQRAQALIAAVDAGGVPLHPARVNDIARRLGLEVSTRAPIDETIARIRQALLR